MVYQVPESDSSSTCSTRSFKSVENPDIVGTSTNQNMSNSNFTNPDVSMTANTRDEIIASLTDDDLNALVALLREKQAQGNPSTPNPNPVPVPATPVIAPVRRDTALPKWNGQPEELEFYLQRLEAKIEMDMEPYFHAGQICMDMIDSLPDNKKSRVESWFKERRKCGNFNWRELLLHFYREFQDHQAQQSALEALERMEQGPHQYFLDFLKDFEYKVAQSGGAATHTLRHQTMMLKGSLNRRLRRSLLGLKLPAPENYNAWVSEVKEIAAELEGFDDYRPRGSNQTKTCYGAVKGGSVKDFSKTQEIDADGDTSMSGTNGLLAAIAGLINQNNANIAGIGTNNSERGIKKETKFRPRAPWRSKEEYKRLLDRGVCTRCEKKGHNTRNCDQYRPAQRPNLRVSNVGYEEDGLENKESESGNDEP